MLHFRNAVDVEVSDVEVYLDIQCCRSTCAEHFRSVATIFKNLKIIPFAFRSGVHFENEGIFLNLGFLSELTTFLTIFFDIIDSLLHYSYIITIITIITNIILFVYKRYTYSVTVLNLQLLLYHSKNQKISLKSVLKIEHS